MHRWNHIPDIFVGQGDFKNTLCNFSCHQNNKIFAKELMSDHNGFCCESDKDLVTNEEPEPYRL